MVAHRKHAIVSVLTSLLIVVACAGPATTPAIVSVTIDDGERSVTVGATLALTVTVDTTGGASKAVLWSSDVPDTATVSSAGVITGVSPGEARITATSAHDATKSDTITITITPPPITPAVQSISIDAGDRSVLLGETLPLSATVISVGGANEAVTWKSDDTTTATVSATGMVTGVTTGEALITVSSVFDMSKSDSTLISVVSVPPGAPARISIVTGDSQTAKVGSAVPIPPAVRVRDADDIPLRDISVTFTVTAGNGAVAPTTPVTTNADGIATLSSWTLGNTAGVNGVRATITGTNPSISATFSATSVPGLASPATSIITANPTSLLANGTATSQLTIQLKDAFGNDLTSGGATVTFATPSQGSIGTVTDNGNGTYTATYTAGTAAGTVTTTPRLSGVNFTNTTTITLTAAVLNVTINQTNPTVRLGDTMQLTATVATVGGASSAVTWASSNTSVATINPTTGLVTNSAGGTTTITATSTYDTSKKGTTTLTVPAPMVLTVEADFWSTNASAALALRGAVDVNIDWGDGNWTGASTAGHQSHTYAGKGPYTIRIAGRLDHFGGGGAMVIRVTSWGDLGLISLSGAFASTWHLNALPVTLPPTVTDTSWMFLDTMFDGDLSTFKTWDVSNVTNMAGMFSGGQDYASLNPDIGGWDVSNVTNMGSMFYTNLEFDRDIGGWDVSNVTNMAGMFHTTDNFNHDISRWDVSNVTDTAFMFYNSNFMQDIGGWDVSNVTSMAGMFGADDDYGSVFNRYIGGWNVSSVTDMSRMFSTNVLFDQDISGWDVSNVTNMTGMFEDADEFNQDLSDWCVVQIPAEPHNFARNAYSWILPKPTWGTCPSH